MILVDSSVWIGFLRGKRGYRIEADEMERFCVCGPIIQEVLQGQPEGPAAGRFRDLFLALPRLGEPVGTGLYLEAARIHRLGRHKGYTIRSSVDCLIAAIALAGDVPVWHRDRDFSHIARFTGLKVYRRR
jgi:hypothetical protein